LTLYRAEFVSVVLQVRFDLHVLHVRVHEPVTRQLLIESGLRRGAYGRAIEFHRSHGRDVLADVRRENSKVGKANQRGGKTVHASALPLGIE
jgi:hypothetical protein